MAELETRPTRRRLSPGVVLLGAVLLLLFLFMAALGVGWIAAKQRVRAELARIRAAGEPVTPEDLEAFYARPPADRDATQLWLDAIAPLEGAEFSADAEDLPFLGGVNDELPPPGAAWPKQPALERFLEKYRESLEMMHCAAKRGGAARYPADYADNSTIELPIVQLRNGARLLQFESEVAARRHDSRAAAKAIDTILVLAQSVHNEPTVVSQLIRFHFDDIARSQLERHLPNTRFSDSELEEMDQHFAASDYSTSFKRALLGERATSLMYFADPETMGEQAPSGASSIFRPSDELLYLHLMQKLIAAFRGEGPALRDAVDDVERQAEKLSKEPLAALRYPFSNALLPPMQLYTTTLNEAIAKRDSARAAVAIERFRLRHGKLPATLDALTPEFLYEVPLDPFDGQPLRYRIDPSEYKVYSVGVDGIDQGGQSATASGPYSAPQDLVFRVTLSNSQPPKEPQP